MDEVMYARSALKMSFFFLVETFGKNIVEKRKLSTCIVGSYYEEMNMPANYWMSAERVSFIFQTCFSPTGKTNVKSTISCGKYVWGRKQ